MATKSNLQMSEIGSQSPKLFNRFRSTIETAFYRNNVVEIKSLAEAYELAKNAAGTIVLDQPIVHAKELGLPEDAKVLLFNDGKITGRQAKLRKLVDKSNVDELSSVAREAIFASRKKKMYHAQAYVGLHENFMVKAHLLVPEGYENTVYSWIMNFQAVDAEYTKKYEKSLLLDEGDIYVYADPDLCPAEFPTGAAIFDADNNAACILGMRYFGEFKKGTLTLAWTIAERNGYASCHGGQKRFNLGKGKEKVVGVFGLSGSGKSTITLSDHGGKMDFTVLHDDAFIISTVDGSSICLEQSYFDKTADYPLTNPQAKYFVTVQNCGVTKDANGKLVPVTEDITNGNGRTVKSRYAAENREYRFGKSIDAIFWIMKDASLPPIVKVKSPELASVMGATLSTKRTSAEYRPGEDPNALVIVPYANPFRLYPLEHDYNKFKFLFQEKNTDCYIINTGSFLQKKDGSFYEKKINKEITLEIVEKIAKDEAKFEKFGPFESLEYMPVEGYLPEFGDAEYLLSVKNRMLDRLGYVEKLDGMEKLPQEALDAIKKTASQIK